MSDVSKLNIHGTIYDLKDAQAREELSEKADIDQIPSKTSQLDNDSGFITSSDIPTIPTKTSQLDNDSGFITSSDIPSIPTKTSDLTNDSGFITSSDVYHETLGCKDLGIKDSNFNLNDLQLGETCYWSIGNAPVNYPFDGGRVYCFMGYSTNMKVQIGFRYSEDKIYIRHLFGSWSTWRSI